MALEDLLKHAKKINKLADRERFSEAAEILTVLKKQTMTLDLLQKSKIGHAVNALRKSAQSAGESDIAASSKGLLLRKSKITKLNKQPEKTEMFENFTFVFLNLNLNDSS